MFFLTFAVFAIFYAKEEGAMTNKKPRQAAVFSMLGSVVAAAAEYEDQRKDDHPGAAVIEDVTKAVVVIHKDSLLYIEGGFAALQ
jgi:hypothetical protein